MPVDTITRSVLLAASPTRVWRALTDADEFGQWFRVAITGAFRAGETVSCRSLYPGAEHMRWEMRILAMEPERRLVWQWPAFDRKAFPDDPDIEAWLTVEIGLVPEADGTRLTLSESGFAALPDGPGLAVWQRNEEGWTMQLGHIASHVTNTAF